MERNEFPTGDLALGREGYQGILWLGMKWASQGGQLSSCGWE